jgi:hypothetical protein
MIDTEQFIREESVEPLRFAVIGIGGVAKAHLRSVSKLQSEILGRLAVGVVRNPSKYRQPLEGIKRAVCSLNWVRIGHGQVNPSTDPATRVSLRKEDQRSPRGKVFEKPRKRLPYTVSLIFFFGETVPFTGVDHHTWASA